MPFWQFGTHTGGHAAIAANLAVQATATELSGFTNYVSCADASNVATKLPASNGGNSPVVVRNTSAQTMTVFPQTGGSINGGSANASVSIATLKTGIFVPINATDWLFVLGA